MVTQTFASWNQLSGLLRQLDYLRTARRARLNEALDGRSNRDDFKNL